MANSGHFSDEQVAIFEAVYVRCPSPSASQWQQIKCDHHPLLDHIEDGQIQAWFQNRTSREKTEKYKQVAIARERLIAEKNLLMEENVKLKKKVIQLLRQNDALLRNRMMPSPMN